MTMTSHSKKYIKILITLIAIFSFLAFSQIIFAQEGAIAPTPTSTGSTGTITPTPTNENGNIDSEETNSSENTTYSESTIDLMAPPVLPDVRNPGNLPFINDPELSIMEHNGHYGTIKNETGYQAFMKAIEFAIKTLIKLVGIMALFGLTEGLVRFSVAHGEEEQKEKGVKMITWSIVGLVLSLIAHAVVTAILQLITGIGTINI